MCGENKEVLEIKASVQKLLFETREKIWKIFEEYRYKRLESFYMTQLTYKEVTTK